MADSKRALITGITGQDGQHLCELLDTKGYEVFGLIRGQRNARREAFDGRVPLRQPGGGRPHRPDLAAGGRRRPQADEVYNLAAISHVGYSFRNPQLTADVTAKGVLNLLEAIRSSGRADEVRFYQASTSEMFGGLDYNRPGAGYNEDSLFHPRSPYGVAKLYGHWIARNYRESYGMFVATGILFNHEGERRGLEFVTRKITDGVARDPPRPAAATWCSATCGPSGTGDTPATTCAACGRCSSTTSPTTSCWRPARRTPSRSS